MAHELGHALFDLADEYDYGSTPPCAYGTDDPNVTYICDPCFGDENRDRDCGTGEVSGCGDGICSRDETDETCGEDCGCGKIDRCSGLAPYGCWCDPAAPDTATAAPTSTTSAAADRASC